MREFSTLASNWRASETAQQYLERHGVPVIWDLDTRALVRHLRQAGALRGVISTDGASAEELVAAARALPTMAGQELAGRVTCGKAYEWAKGSVDFEHRAAARRAGNGERHYRVVAYDYGIKQNILRLLVDHHCDVTVVPARTSAEDVSCAEAEWSFSFEWAWRS